MTLSEAVDAVTKIIGCYPNGGQNAGKGYIGALAATLGGIPRQIALRCADLNAGVVRECKFLPTVADLIAWCEPGIAELQRTCDRDRRVAEQVRERTRSSRNVTTASGKRQYSYAEFLDMANRGEVKPRPVGRFEQPQVKATTGVSRETQTGATENTEFFRQDEKCE